MNVSEITDTWTVTNRAGAEIARVDGASMDIARETAKKLPEVAESNAREQGFGLRRLSTAEI
jgi:hypothetical protein